MSHTMAARHMIKAGPTKPAKGAKEYYSVSRILNSKAHYNLVIGERGNGKTTSPFELGIRNYMNGDGNFAYMRQMDTDIKGSRGSNVMRSLEFGGENKDLNLIDLWTDGKFNTTKYYARAWYLGLTQLDGEGNSVTVYEKDPCGFAYALNQVKHDKSSTPPNVTTIIFDEFIPLDGVYLVDETVLFRNAISTMVRDAAKANIFMLANVTTWNSPYFKMFGFQRDVKNLEPGDIRVYTYPKSRLDGTDIEMRVAVEYTIDTQSTSGGKPSDVYFVMADEHSAMITDGKFSIPNYPECPHHFKTSNVKCTYWTVTDDDIFRSRLIKVNHELFVFNDLVDPGVFEKIADGGRDIFYSMEFTGKVNHYISPLTRYGDKRTWYLTDAYAAGRMFFENNEVGENLMYYALQAKDKSILTL